MRSYNYSALATAQKCPQLFKYKYIENLPEPGAESLDLHFGTAMHVGIESILTSQSDGLFEFEAYWNSLKDKDLKRSRFGYDELKDQAEKLLTRFQRPYAKKFVVTQMEQTLYGHLGGINVYGTPDFIGSYEGIPSIVDFKTTKSRYIREKLISSEQLYLYAELARQVLDYKAEQVVYFQFVKGPQPSISVLRGPITEDLLQSALTNLYNQCKHWEGLGPDAQFIRNKSNCIIGDTPCTFFERCYPQSQGG